MLIVDSTCEWAIVALVSRLNKFDDESCIMFDIGTLLHIGAYNYTRILVYAVYVDC